MDIQVREAGNSLVVTIPKDIISELHIKKGDVFSINASPNEIKLVPKRKKLRGEAFLEEYFGKPFNAIEPWDYEDVPTGIPQGEEIW